MSLDDHNRASVEVFLDLVKIRQDQTGSSGSSPVVFPAEEDERRPSDFRLDEQETKVRIAGDHDSAVVGRSSEHRLIGSFEQPDIPDVHGIVSGLIQEAGYKG